MTPNWFTATQTAWGSIESRLRWLGAPDSMFDADFEAQVERAIERFEQVQQQREAAGHERVALPDDPRALVPGRKPWFMLNVQRSATTWKHKAKVNRNYVLKKREKKAREAAEKCEQ